MALKFILSHVKVQVLLGAPYKENSMKAYGHSRKDKQECKYGCCTSKSGKEKNCRYVVDKANKKTARQDEKVYIDGELNK